MFVGDDREPVLRLKWWRPGKRWFDPERWLDRRVRSAPLRPVNPEGPKPAGFQHVRWIPEAEPKASERPVLWLWYGYAPKADLVLEIAVSSGLATRVKRMIASRVIPSLRAYGLDEATRWSLYGASFESPAGFRMVERRLLLGDITLRLVSADKSRLMLRQVYPATLALARRKLERWLDVRPFKQHRRFRAAGPAERWTVSSFGRTLEGIRLIGRKRLPFPLGFCASRETVSAIAEDKSLDRLLLAELDSPGPPDEALVGRVVGQMNWAMLESVSSKQ